MANLPPVPDAVLRIELRRAGEGRWLSTDLSAELARESHRRRVDGGVRFGGDDR